MDYKHFYKILFIFVERVFLYQNQLKKSGVIKTKKIHNFWFLMSGSKYFDYKYYKCQKILKFNQDWSESAGYNFSPLHYPTIQSVLPSPLKPQLYPIPIKNKKTI